MTAREHNYFVYLMASKSRTLYCGITDSLKRRVQQHKEETHDGFTATYRCHRLLWFEQFQYVDRAILREKQIKSWWREKKVTLIEQQNPTWEDLSEVWN